MLRIEIAETVESFAALAEAWRKLASDTPSCHFTQTYDWCRLGWEHRVSQPNDKLRCVTAWQADQLVAVWPFIQRGGAGKPKRLDPIGCGMNEEYADPLLAPVADNVEACTQILQTLVRGTDIFHAQFVAVGSNMQKAINAQKCVRHTVPIDAFQIDRRSAPTWDAFMSAYPSKLRVNLRGRRKQLREQGVVTFEMADSPADQAAVIDWSLQQKQAWLKQHDKSSDWFYRPETRSFLLEAARLKDDIGRLGLFALKLDGVTVAATIVTIDRERIEGYVTSFDPAYGRF
jgi:CelD/BcsL family acetyltransferase involved in cellulose biosynthesis